MKRKGPIIDLRPIEETWTEEQIKAFDEECELHKEYAELMIKKHEKNNQEKSD